MDLAKKRILVTGADGFIGSHLVEGLLDKGCQVRAFVHYNSFNSWGWLDTFPKEKLDKIDVFAGDVRDPHGVKAALAGCEVVFHLAALIAIPYSYHSPDTYVDTNVKGTLNVVQAARELGVAVVVYTSTSEVYGTARFVPITEEHPLQGQSPYSASKIGADQIATSKIVFGSKERIEEKMKALPGKTINTSYVERSNLNWRLWDAHLTRKRLTFAKSFTWLKAKCSICVSFYNFIRPHETLGRAMDRTFKPKSPAMAAKITNQLWNINELLGYKFIVN